MRLEHLACALVGLAGERPTVSLQSVTSRPRWANVPAVSRPGSPPSMHSLLGPGTNGAIR